MPQPTHEAQIQQLENHAEQVFFQNPNNLTEVFKDLDKLQHSESKQQFAKDLEAINLKLHQDGWLPMVELVMTPKGGFMLQRQSSGEWNQEARQEKRQTNDSSYSSPGPQRTPLGYNPNYDPNGGASGKGGYRPKATYDSHAKGDPGRFKYDPRVSGDAAKRILSAAHSSIGHQMWRETNHGASGANEGCAASVSAVLRNAGVSKVNEMECHRLQAALQKEGWTATTTPSPGDVVFGYGGLSRAHVGIVDEHSQAMDNHSHTGQWSPDSLSYFNNWNQTVFLHPPQGTDNPAPAPAAAAAHVVAPAAVQPS